MSGLYCPECYQYFDDGEIHLGMHAQQGQNEKIDFISAFVARRTHDLKVDPELIHDYLRRYVAEDEYVLECRLTGFVQGLAAGIEGGSNAYPGDGYLMASDGVEALQEGYQAGHAAGSGLPK